MRFIAKAFCRAASNSSSSDGRCELGQRGEKLACRFLRQNGYRVLYRNFRAPHGGEVDIVARHIDTLVFIEVKTRTSLEFGRPSDAVNRKKQRLMSRGALAWLKLLRKPGIRCRFDVVEVLLPVGGKPEFTLLQDVFELPPPYLY